MRGLPATGRRTLPGKRVEPMRAWMTATTLMCSRALAVLAVSLGKDSRINGI
jgi:hypothetical protein